MPIVEAGFISIGKRLQTGECVLDVFPPSGWANNATEVCTPHIEAQSLPEALRKLADRYGEALVSAAPSWEEIEHPFDVEHRWTLFTTRELCDIAHACRMLHGYPLEEEAGFTRLANEAWGEHVQRTSLSDPFTGEPGPEDVSMYMETERESEVECPRCGDVTVMSSAPRFFAENSGVTGAEADSPVGGAD